MRRNWFAPVLILALTAVLAEPAFADDKKVDAVLKLTEGSVAAGIGWSWGHGTLTYMGKSYRVKVDGLTVGEVGMTNAKAKGNVYNLKKLEDFTGVYAAGGAGATAGKGRGAGALTNANGVSILLTSITKGASLKIAAEGLKLEIEK
ncbi:MAG TPA: hypothetical protein VFA98_07960 [Thermoanaerobaculia bacterium]|nr:hypothetical protein [Thermoanaerobaculia bacterium]